jgi:hypothetical protein
VKRHYNGPAEALLAVVENDVLSWRRAAQRLREAHIGAACDLRDAASDVRLAIAHLRCAVEGIGRRLPRDPVQLDRVQAGAAKRGMVGALDHDEGITGEVLGGDKPGRLGLALLAADAEPAPLTERVAFEARVAADDGSVEALDRPWPAGQPLADEVPERALANEADTGRVSLPGAGNAALSRDCADVGLAKPADRKFAERELRRVERMQEIALVLVAVETAQQAVPAPDARVVAGRETLGAEPLGVVEADAEFHLAVAEHVGIWRTPGLEFREEVREHAFAVLGRKARLVQGDAEFLGDTPRILEVGCGRTVPVLILAPVRHEKRFDLVAGILEQGRRNRGVDTARERDDDARHGLSPLPAESRARRAAHDSTCRAGSGPRAGNRRRTGARGGCGARLRARRERRG